MATNEINPYGNGESTSVGFPIVDNCNTDSGVSALSARQGKRLNGLCGIAQGMVINALGDSITEGWIGPGSANPKWTEQIASTIGCTVNNYGVGGSGFCADTEHETFFARLSRMSETDIDMLLIFGGTNDFAGNRAHSLGTISDAPALGSNVYASFKYLINAAIAKYPHAVIAVITPMRRGDNITNSYGIKLEDIVDAEVAVAKYYGIPCLDFFHDCGLTSQTAQMSIYTNDGIHPNQACIDKFLAPAFTEFVRETLAFKKPNNS